MTQVHFIGICGTAMATLAAMLRERGFSVRGSDEHVYPPMSDFLRTKGIDVLEGYRAEHVTSEIDFVVIGNAVSRGNPEVEEVLDRKIRYRSLPDTIRDTFLWAARSVVIAGTHGKTTTASMAAWLLARAGRDPSLLTGGIAANFDGSYRLGGGREFVIEGDEYDSAFFDKTAKFLKYLPDVAVVGNIEFDHADIYPDLEAIRLAFRRLVNLVPRNGRLILGADCPEAAALAGAAPCRVETFGLSNAANWQAHDLHVTSRGTRFQLIRQGEAAGIIEVPMPGVHNVRNALAALAAVSAVGVSPAAAAPGLGEFKGVKRRLEVAGEAGGVTVYDDFAHHPTAVAESIAALKATEPARRVWAVFEPRSATSCRRVFQADFVRALAEADETIVAAVFRSNLPEAERLSAEQVVADLEKTGRRARHIPAVDDIVAAIAREARQGDRVLIMSNGAFGGIHAKLLAALGER